MVHRPSERASRRHAEESGVLDQRGFKQVGLCGCSGGSLEDRMSRERRAEEVVFGRRTRRSETKATHFCSGEDHDCVPHIS